MLVCGWRLIGGEMNGLEVDLWLDQVITVAKEVITVAKGLDGNGIKNEAPV